MQKESLINSMYYASKFINMVPLNETPEKTEGYEGFYHLTSMKGLVGADRSSIYS